MQIILYNQSQPYTGFTRKVSGAISIVGNLRDSCDVFNPEIEISYSATNAAKNYAYIPDFNRYYYFSEPPTIEGRTMILHLHGDSFYNYAAVIRRSQCIAERSSSKFDLMLPDSAVLGEQGYNYFSRVLPYTFHPENGQYVLTISGGV